MPRPPRDEETILHIARLHHEEGLMQTEIARDLKISEATVSRYLKQAMELGFIEVRVASRAFRNFDLERRLVRRFGLVSAIVIEPRTSAAETRRILGNAAGRALEDLLANGSVIGVSNGETVAAVAAEARRSRSAHIDVVTLIGGVGRAEEATHTGQICRTLADRLGGRSWILPVPAVVDSPALAETLRGMEACREVFSLFDRMTVAVIGVGALTPESSTFQHGLFTQGHLRGIVARHAAGSICARFYDADGKGLPTDLDACTLSITLEQLATVPHRFAVALGADKVPAIRAGIAGRLINMLGTDAPTAEALLG